eukprot:TRINITY_DN48638_c0_g1_i1.p1 TRINITY_DN48638_c0_g1~~TRINITY_DN48638_c0_g1_i1.p1  ORF type:complete len:222 (-),score=46.51 TRINITY_DN48638_c0_g1_i1:141-806(-)
MSKPFAARLHDAFEKHAALQLPTDDFVFILRRVDETLSEDVLASLISMFGSDSGARVDVQKFCAWFEDTEPEPHCAQPVLTSSGGDAPGNMANSQTSPQLDSDVRICVLGADGALRGGCADGKQAGHSEVNAKDGDVEELPETGLGDSGEELCLRSLRFSRQVAADDDSFWSLGSEDKCTLPSHRVLTEREKLLADFRASLNQVNDRLKSSPVKIKNHLRG